MIADFSALAAGGATVYSFDAHGHGKLEPQTSQDINYLNVQTSARWRRAA